METNENENTTIQNLWDYSKSSPEREIHRNTRIPQKIGKNSNTQANLTPKIKNFELEKEQQTKPTPIRRREIINI